MEMLKSHEKRVLSEGEKKEECYKLLKSHNDEVSQLKGKLQEIASERDNLKTKGAKCDDELTACQQAGTPSV